MYEPGQAVIGWKRVSLTMTKAADDVDAIRARIKDLAMDDPGPRGVLARLTHKEDCAFLRSSSAGCSCGAVEKGLSGAE